MLFSFGSNGSAQLGLGHDRDVDEPAHAKRPRGDFSLLVKVAAGGNHTLTLYTSGDIYASGDNSNGRCSVQAPHKFISTFQDVNVGEPRHGMEHPDFTHCAATWEASTFVVNHRAIWTCGSGYKGELGQGPRVTQSIRARQLDDFPPRAKYVVDISACMTHTVVVLSDGTAWGWGSGRKGQLGLPPADCWTPRMIEGPTFRIKRAVCGRDFTFLLGTEGHWYYLGSDKWKIAESLPDRIPRWLDVSASWSSLYILLHGGTLIARGRNDKEQLPARPLPPLRQIAAGSEHAVALTEAGHVLVWGWGEHGNCGPLPEDSTNVAAGEVAIRTSERISAIGAGCATTWFYSPRSDCQVSVEKWTKIGGLRGPFTRAALVPR